MTCYYVLLTTRASFNVLQITISNHIFKLYTRWHYMLFPTLVFVTDLQLHALIRLEVSPPSFDTGARMKYLCGPRLNQSMIKNLAEPRFEPTAPNREADALTTTPQAFANVSK